MSLPPGSTSGRRQRPAVQARTRAGLRRKLPPQWRAAVAGSRGQAL